MATQDERTLGSGITMPKWMKNRMNDKFPRLLHDIVAFQALIRVSVWSENGPLIVLRRFGRISSAIFRFDLDQSTFSPTELDDTFMFNYRRPPSAVVDNNSMIASNLSQNLTVSAINNEKPDFSKHPTPCQKYLQLSYDVSPPPQTNPQMKTKSSGTDDGFKGEAAECGSSIIRVASKMVSGKLVHGFTVKEDDQNFDQSQPKEEYDLQKRRSSRSLPASPLVSPHTSPKGNRKILNKYFTGAFTDVDKSKGGWIFSNLMARREMSQSVGYIGEESKEDLERSESTASVDEMTSYKKAPVFKAKPSELREMNFWSPTSM